MKNLLSILSLITLVGILVGCGKSEPRPYTPVYSTGGPIVPRTPFEILQLTPRVNDDSVNTASIVPLYVGVGVTQPQYFDSLIFTFFDANRVLLFKEGVKLDNQATFNGARLTAGQTQTSIDNPSKYTNYITYGFYYGYKVPASFKRQAIFVTAKVKGSSTTDSTTLQFSQARQGIDSRFANVK